MKKISKKNKRLPLVLALAMLLSVLCMPINGSGKRVPLSPALEIIAQKMPMVLNAPLGAKISFGRECFESALGDREIGGIVITSLPPEGSGALMLGELRVVKGQRITGDSLSSLTFVPNGETVSSEFTFVPDSGYEHRAVMYFLDGANYSPTSSGIDEGFYKLETYKNIAVNGVMRCVDPELDKISYEIVSYPEKGLLTFKSRENGEYTYAPMKNYVGRDSFSYIAVDEYGNRSQKITVDISVGRSESGTVFEDMIFDPAHYGAILLHNKGIMKGEREGSSDVFMPEKPVSHADFLVIAMKSAETALVTSAPSEIVETVNDFPSEYRQYILTAYDKGLLTETELKELNIYSEITKAEACVIVDCLIDAEDVRVVPAFKDIEEVPKEALDAVCSLLDIGVISTENGLLAPSSTLTRADAAEMLSEVVKRS